MVTHGGRKSGKSFRHFSPKNGTLRGIVWMLPYIFFPPRPEGTGYPEKSLYEEIYTLEYMFIAAPAGSKLAGMLR